jgi:hypothetical protein
MSYISSQLQSIFCVQGASRQVSMIFKSQLSILIGLGVGKIWCILLTAVGLWFSGGFPHQHLAYVEWFTLLSQAPVDQNTKLFKISQLVTHGEQ